MADERLVHYHHHFLIVSGAAQGQITPARRLAHRLVRVAGVRATVVVPLSALRRMFPGESGRGGGDVELVVSDGAVDYAAFTDGFDDGFQPAACDGAAFVGRLQLVGPGSLSRVAGALRARGRPVTCVIYTLLLPFAAAVARGLSVPAFFFWTMPATVLSIYYHYFHGHAKLVAAAADKNNPNRSFDVPGLPFLRVRDLPSLLTGPSPYLPAFREMFEVVETAVASANSTGEGETKPRVLVNTFDALEPEALMSVPGIDLIPVGPMVGDDTTTSGDLFEEDRSHYMKWLDEQPDGSVVYVSFGSLAVLSARQLDEIRECLEASGRPFLWVVRRDNRNALGADARGPTGLVVEWCNQARVLAHRATGCFVTHCGWNSMLESVTCGVPVVMAPLWSDQATNARMAEARWGVGVRAEADEDGTVRTAEFARCVDTVMGESSEGRAVRECSRKWSARAAQALAAGDGSAERHLKQFLDGIGR